MIIDNENPGLRLVRKLMRAIRSAVRDHQLMRFSALCVSPRLGQCVGRTVQQ
jgi:hypothetical protein